MKSKFKIEDIDEYQTKSSLNQLYKTDLLQICQVLKIDTINDDDTKTYIIDQILNHYNNNNNNRNNNNSNSNNNNNQDADKQQQQDNKRIYTDKELSSCIKKRLINICKDLKIEYRESDTNKTLIQYIMVYQKTEVTPTSLSGGYSLPWSIIASILTRAWNDAKYCTCIYPNGLQDLQTDLDCKIEASRDTYSFKILGQQFNSKIGQYTEQVKSNNQHCPQHAMYYRDDSLYHPWAHFDIELSEFKPIEIQWKQTMLTISKKVFHHLSTTISRTFTFPLNDENKMPREKFEKSVWSHINNQYNGIKVANRIYLPHSNQVYLDAPPWFAKSIEHVTLYDLTTFNHSNISQLVNLKSIALLGHQDPELGTLKNLTSITIDSQFYEQAIEQDLVMTLDRPMTKLLLAYPSVILKAKDIVIESLQVIRLDVDTHMALFKNTGAGQDQDKQSSPRNLPNLRHVHIEFIDEKDITNFILPDTVTTLSNSNYPYGNEDIYWRFLEINPHITSLRLTSKIVFNFEILETIGNQLKQQSKLSRIMVYSQKSLTDIQHQQLIQSNIYLNASKDMSLGQEFKKYIFYRNDQQHNQIINNNTTTLNNNNNNPTIFNNDCSTTPLLPNIIINQIIKLLWNNFESIQSNCPHHGWFDRSSLYLPLSLYNTQKSIYQLRLSKLSTISKSTRSFVFEKLFTKFGTQPLFAFKFKPFVKTIKRISTFVSSDEQLDLLQQANTIQLPSIPTITKHHPFNNLRKLNLSNLQVQSIESLQQFIEMLEIPLVKLTLPLNLRPILPFLAKHASATLKQSLESIQVEVNSNPIHLEPFQNIKHIIVMDKEN
ncbi:hypothetical protein DFA_09166 [Cavenderia fasciculata]|uniref:Uncharacterized protein n=1 Tax=Cavenderia fasciculata TaxID=261658 RepID=F4Q6V9_CACFS|nr:uncharacterized protein DFA_09166 [Cavenderia fasciculata]EGG16141.1 hypothetical protein DFA_09166 [Cavenderia fasciculata]|eukprot:XP_004352594.1 hypothetical protein DFA_09166 [Cavenderia fasciculata]